MRKLAQLLFILCLLFSLPAYGLAQNQTGSISGHIIDNEGNGLPGVSVTVTSPAIMGKQTYVTVANGAFRFPALPPGTYTLVAELAGFKTITRENIIIRVGMVTTIDLTMEVSTIETQVTVMAPSPVVDVQSSKLAVVMDKDMLKNIPLARDLYDIVNSAPGAISENVTYRRTSSIHGSTVRGNTYAFDGVNMNDPVVMYPLTNINFDVMDEVEMITAGHTASIGYTDGAYINIVTKSGGNKFSGGAVVYYTNKDLALPLWTDEQIQALGVAKPESNKNWLDGSLTFGGPLLVDKLWFFINARYIKQELQTNFIGPWTDFFGWTHDTYDWTHEEKMGFVKLTGQLTPKIKLMGMFNLVDIYRPMYEQPGSRQPFESTRIWDHEKGYTYNGILTYVFDQNTFVDLRAGYVPRLFPLPLQDRFKDYPLIDNFGDVYGVLTNARFNEIYLRKRFQTGLYLTRFQDNFLGGNHEFKAGVELETTYGDWDWWRKDNMIWVVDSRNANPYYRYGTYGRVDFYVCGPEKGSTKIQDKGARIGVYIQDSVNFGDRLTLNLGLRFDRSWGWKPAVTKKAAGNPVSVMLGETLVSDWLKTNYPANFPNGLNPWADATSPEWKNIITWNDFSPRLGLTYDPFGDGKTAFKFSFNRYTEYLMLQYFSTLHPFYPRNFGFNWWDTNSNNYPDVNDTYVIRPADYRAMDPEFAKKQLDPNVVSPKNDELTVGIWREIFKEFSLGLNFIYKNKWDIAEIVFYSPDTGEYWYYPDQDAAKKYWIPFTTTIPGTDQYPSQIVTFYVRSNNSPAPFNQFTNVPELKRKYWAFELIFQKRMSSGWQFNGSVVYSKAYGNIGAFYGTSWGWSGVGITPNGYVNAWGPLDIDRPLQIKFMSTVQLPLRIFLSGFYQYQSGAPWVRNCGIRPPVAWCTENNAYRDYYFINIETPDKRRLRATNTLDLRLEKEFKLGDFGRLGAYLDVLNLLGWSGVNVGLNDLQYWDPVAEGENQSGTKTLATGYKVINSVEGLRQVRFSLRFSFN